MAGEGKMSEIWSAGSAVLGKVAPTKGFEKGGRFNPLFNPFCETPTALKRKVSTLSTPPVATPPGSPTKVSNPLSHQVSKGVHPPLHTPGEPLLPL